MTELAFESATTLARMVREKQISSVELLDYYFNRVDQHNPSLNAIIWQMRDEARARAQQIDEAIARGADIGPLGGVPMTIKESYDVTGTPTTWGLPELKDNIAVRDALSVQRLKKAGVVLFGKTNVPLRLADFQSYNEIYGTSNNPWDVERSPGGSSGGSAAALAAGLTGIDSGSDIGGSIRNPAHFSGVFGHKPTWNLLPPRGHATPGILSPSDLSVIGPLARSAADLELAVRAMAGPDEIQSRGLSLDLPTLTRPVSELRIAVWRDDELAPVDNGVLACVDKVVDALKQLGAEIDYDARPEFTSEHTHSVYQCLLNATMSCRSPADVYDEMVRDVETRERANEPVSELRKAQVARFRDWINYNEQRTHIRWAWHEFFKDYDFVIAPIMATTAIKHDHREAYERTVTVNGEPQAYFTQLFWAGVPTNAYLPVTMVPAGPADDGLPVGVQIVGPEYSDLQTIGIASVLEREGISFQAPPNYL